MRLKSSAEFQKVRLEGQAIQGKLMVLGVLKGQEGESRIGYITTRRTGNAVARNRARRRLREIVRENYRQMESGLRIVVIVRKRAITASYEELNSEWVRLARRACILHCA